MQDQRDLRKGLQSVHLQLLDQSDIQHDNHPRSLGHLHNYIHNCCQCSFFPVPQLGKYPDHFDLSRHTHANCRKHVYCCPDRRILTKRKVQNSCSQHCIWLSYRKSNNFHQVMVLKSNLYGCHFIVRWWERSHLDWSRVPHSKYSKQRDPSVWLEGDSNCFHSNKPDIDRSTIGHNRHSRPLQFGQGSYNHRHLNQRQPVKGRQRFG